MTHIGTLISEKLESCTYSPPLPPGDTPVIRRLREADIPTGYKKVKFETTDPSRCGAAFEVCQKFANAGQYVKKPGLLLYGPTGSGKTHMALCILRRIVECTEGRKCVRFWNIPRGLIAIKSSFDSGESHDILELADYYFVVLDDFGKAKMTEWVNEQWYSLIDALSANRRRLVITTNLPLSQLKEILDPSVFSRILGMCHPVRIDGSDIRLQRP